MTWEEFKKQKLKPTFNNNKSLYIYNCHLKQTNIECPQCNNLIYKDISTLFLSDPPMHRYYCIYCKKIIGYD